MKTKAKKFSKKLLALFMAVVMGITCFSGAISAFGVTKSNALKYTDDAIDYNELGWAMLSDEQVATAALDYLDNFLLPQLKNMEKKLAYAVAGAKIPVLTIKWDLNNRQVLLKAAGITLATITVKLGSVDELIETLTSVKGVLDGGLVSTAEGLGLKLGALGDLDFTPVIGMSRANNTSVEILRGVVGLIYQNIDIINRLLQGTFDLGTLNGALDIYGLLGGLVNAPAGYQTTDNGMIYSIVQSAIFSLTNWYTDEEKQAFRANPSTFVFDDQLLDKMTTKLLDKISVLVTYDQEYWDFDLDESGKPYFAKDDKGNTTTNFKMTATQDTSATRYLKIKALMVKDNKTYQQAATELGYDPNLVYSDEFKDDDGNYLNVLLFAYGNADPKTGLATESTKMIKLTKVDSLFTFGKQALAMAWNTVLKDTIKLLHVNYDVDRGHGSNFDNAFYYYMDHNTDGLTWNRKNPSANYTDSNIRSWAKHMVWKDLRTDENRKDPTAIKYMPLYESYGITVDAANVNAEKNIVATEAEAIDLFLSWVKDTLTYDRTLKKGSTGDWTDIDPTTLFNKTRYSPLADFYFNMETGPINLYFMQLGCDKIDTFFDAYFDEKKDTTDATAYSYSSMVALLNDALVAAVDDIFTDSKNVHNVAKRPVSQLAKVGSSYTSITSTEINEITTTLVNNTLKMVQYTADAIDENILKAFYANGGTTLTEANLEKAMIPLLIATLGQINMDGKLVDQIHKEDWNACDDAEDIAFIALREYLSNVQPNYDYSGLAPIVDGKYTATLDGTVLPMARDAIMYVIESYVPVTDGNGNHFKVEYQKPGDAGYYQDGVNDLFTLFNRIICYYAESHTSTKFTETASNGRFHGVANGVAALLGFCEVKGMNVSSTINTNNTLWQNINLIVNKAFPVIGTLQGKGYGLADSYDLIWNKIVKGVLDIGPNDGVSNFINQLLTIVAADPIQNTPVTLTVYDLLEDLLNALFGGRYSGQVAKPVPERASMPTDENKAAPFDYILKKAVVAGTAEGTAEGSGILGKALLNFGEFCGVNGSWASYNKKNTHTNYINTNPDSIIPGVTFALCAVSSLFNIFPIFGNHSFSPVTADFTEGLRSVATKGAAVDYTVQLTNNSVGFNTTTIDGMNNDAVSRNARYYAEITGATVKAANGCTVTPANPTSITKLDPQGHANVTVSITSSADSCYAAVEYKYNIYTYTDKNTEDTNNQSQKVYIAQNLKTTAYKVVNTATDWYTDAYPDGSNINSYVMNIQKVFQNKNDWYGSFHYRSRNDWGASKRLAFLMPTEFILERSNLAKIETFAIAIRNTSGNTAFDGEASYDGVFCFEDHKVSGDGGVYDDATGKYVDVDYQNAIPTFDKATGGITDVRLRDISFDNGTTWDRGPNNAGYSESDALKAKNEKETADGKRYDNSFVMRDHVVYTLDEAKSAKMIKAYHKNPQSGIYEYVYLQGAKSGTYTYENLIKKITMRGPMEGTYMESGKESIAKNYTTVQKHFFRYDGSTDIPAGQYDANIRFFTEKNPGSGWCDMHFYVADDTANAGLEANINTLANYADNYDASDFTDGGAALNAALAALEPAMTVYGQAMVLDNAKKATDKLQAYVTTSETPNRLGDVAYVPYTTENVNGLASRGIPAMPKDILAASYEYGAYFYDEDGTVPIYTNVKLTDADVTDGYDAAGWAVEKDSAGVYRYVNNFAYEYEWQLPSDTNADGTNIYTKHIYVKTNVPKATADGDPIYDEVQFSYYDKYNNKVNSDFEWTVKIPTNYLAVKPYDGIEEYRGCYTQEADEVQYYMDMLKDTVKTDQANDLFTNITKVRNGLNETNFDIITFNKMTSIAKSAESKFSVIIGSYTDKNGNIVKETEMRPADAATLLKALKEDGITPTWRTNSSLTKAQIADYQRLFNQYLPLVVERGYLGDQVEAEIQCTTGTTYDNLTVVSDAVWVDQVDENGNTVKVIKTPAVVKYNNAEGVTVPFGAVDKENGNLLVNNGATKYTEATWNTFVTEIAEAVTMAQTGNSTDYAGNKRNYYNTSADYSACVTECYSEFKQLRVAEIALIEDIPVSGYNVTASLVVATNCSGATATPAVGAYGDYTITLTDATDTVVAETVFSSANGANTFTLAGVPNGTYKMTISAGHAITREDITVVVNGNDVVGGDIPMITCNYNGDEYISGTDAVYVYNNVIVGDNNELYNLNGDEYVAGTDAVIVYNCVGEVNFTPITIE